MWVLYVQLKFTIFENGIGLSSGDEYFFIDRVSHLCSVFEIHVRNTKIYCIKVNKKIEETFEFHLSNLNITKWNITPNYLRNLIIYNDLSKDEDLIQICYVVLSCIEELNNNKSLYKLIVNKLEYYGYNLEDGEQVFFRINGILKSDDILEIMLSEMLFRLKHIKSCKIIDINSLKKEAYAYNQKYLTLLQSEGALY